ncbi:biopolymer transport protein ExbD [Flavobacterium sp. 7E]|uniref:hypothetical protein n=1 Tax=unclassified Flavobacterium TaxID=196869 RepID=UPI0015712420|nr:MULTISPECIES: hypothetical protein [unclassified Flavobacterium]MBE0391298.1 hypothetical protein [Flavobacterium sp. PL002]NRS88100.1 biopolymer transport protein ExbD [Flavobacterium sp. 7E]NRT15736.1 hypothetical protein [Flavobacterium sp. 28A]
MKTTLPFLIVFILTNIFTVQSQKKEFYANDNLEQISKTEFENNTGDDYLKLKFDVDSVFVNISTKRIKKGKINEIQLEAIKSTLALKATNFNENDKIVIYYYPGKDVCNSGGDKEMTRQNFQSYLKKLKKHPKIKQFFIYKSKDGTEEYGDIKWIEDANKLIESLFLKIHYPCNSIVIIDNNGNYYAHRGESNIDEVFEVLKKNFKN